MARLQRHPYPSRPVVPSGVSEHARPALSTRSDGLAGFYFMPIWLRGGPTALDGLHAGPAATTPFWRLAAAFLVALHDATEREYRSDLKA